MVSPTFIPYGRQNITEEDIAAVNVVLRSDFLTQGPTVVEFENHIARLVGAKYCVALANATAALHLAVLVLKLEEGSEGITSPNTFIASANCMPYSGLVPRFADIDDRTYNIDPVSVEKHITSKTRLLIPVHFAGQVADMNKLSVIARNHGLKVIEDAAHAIGSTYEDGSYVGNCKYSDMTVFSFHPVKTITTGEGGAITTNNEALYHGLLALRSHGITRNPSVMQKNPGPWYYEMHDLGFNYRLTDIQAALGLSQLKRLQEIKQRRREIVAKYNKAFSNESIMVHPFEPSGLQSCFHLYVVRIDFTVLKINRAGFMTTLKENGVGTQVHYIPVYQQPWYVTHWGDQSERFPRAEHYYSQTLSLPLFPTMTDQDVTRVIDVVLSTLEQYR